MSTRPRHSHRVRPRSSLRLGVWITTLLVVVGGSRAAPPGPDDGPAAPRAPASADGPAERSRPLAATPGAIEARARRESLAAAAEDGAVVLVLAAGPARGFTGRVRSDDFLYLCPFPAADGALVLFRDGGAIRHRVYLRPRRPSAERWNGATIGPGEATAAAQRFDAALPLEALVPDLAVLLAERRLLLVSATAPADGRERLDGLLTLLAEELPGDTVLARRDRRRRGREQDGTPPNAVVVRPAAALLTDLRAVKSESEIARVRRAIDATTAGLIDAARCIRPGLAEYQIQAIIEFRCRAAGCDRQSFDSIVGSGPNSCVLHYQANRRTMEDSDLVVIDVGGEFEGYAADVTRTFPVSGRFTKRQAEVYDAVLAAQRAGIAAVRPGATLRDVHAAAKAVLAEHGLDRWFLHGTSHSVGLNVHDAWSAGRKLEVGSILTVEPGVYIAAEQLGVRIEDTVLVTADGAVVLSRAAPKDRAELVALMAEEATFDLAPPR